MVIRAPCCAQASHSTRDKLKSKAGTDAELCACPSRAGEGAEQASVPRSATGSPSRVGEQLQKPCRGPGSSPNQLHVEGLRPAHAVELLMKAMSQKHSWPLLESYHITTNEAAADKVFHVCSAQQASIPSAAQTSSSAKVGGKPTCLISHLTGTILGDEPYSRPKLTHT